MSALILDTRSVGTMKKTAIALDPISVEIIRAKMAAIVEQIETNIVRTAYSHHIYEYKDFAVALVDAQGRLILQGRDGIPVFSANVLGLAVADGLAIYGPENLREGDVIICNHAAVLGQHLNNVAMYTPIPLPGGSGLFGFMVILVHWADVGGRTIGSFTSNAATDIFQEGVQFRTVKLWDAGRPVPEIYRMIESNSRFPTMVLGDADAQLSGCLLGRDLFKEMLATYGADVVRSAIDLTWQKSEMLARRFVSTIPDGTYTASGFLDDDGIDIGKRIDIEVAVRISGDTFTVDFSGVAGEVRGPFNSGAEGGGVTAARMAFAFLINPTEGANEGLYRAVQVVLPAGTFLSASPSAAKGRYNVPLVTVIDLTLKALADVLPDHVPAAHHGNVGGHAFTGRHLLDGELFNNQDTCQGGWGALADCDGPGPFKTFIHGGTQNIPIELVEKLYPMRIERFELRSDSGGPGRHRGGLGITKIYRMLAPCRLNASFDRVGCPPWGLAGGAPGAVAEIAIRRTAEPARKVSKGEFDLATGDVVRIDTGGGGGFGSAHERCRDLVMRDVRLGYVSPRAAQEHYGVAVDIAEGTVSAAQDRPARRAAELEERI